MNEHSYRYAFFTVATVCLLLFAALAYVVWNGRGVIANSTDGEHVIAKGPESDAAAADPSTTVMPSPSLTPIQLSPERLQAIGVTDAVVEMRVVSNDLRVPGNVEVNERRLSYLQTRFPGWIQKVFVNASYQYVNKGQPVFTIYSPDLVSTEQEYLLAKQNRDSFTDHSHGTAEHESGWLLQAAADRLRQFGVPQKELARLEGTGTVQHDITIESPASGYVTEFNALPNRYVQAETKLYTIADLSSVWVYANVPQNDIGQLRPGTPASVTVDAYPGRSFKGRVEQILPQVDTTTRTVRVRLVFANPGVALKPGMYVNVNIGVSFGRQLVMPASGVLHSGTRQIAFIDHGGGYLEPREVETGPRIDDHIVVLKGLQAGERIVSSANFLIDSESQLQAAIGSFTPPTPGAGTAAAMNGSPKTVSAQLTTDPSPAQKGINLIRVKLTTTNGKAIGGADVVVTFFMPAMPSMRMAAMKDTASLTEKGDGLYEAPLQLQTGGTWQVTIVAKRNGQVIASKQVSQSVPGGM